MFYRQLLETGMPYSKYNYNTPYCETTSDTGVICTVSLECTPVSEEGKNYISFPLMITADSHQVPANNT